MVADGVPAVRDDSGAHTSPMITTQDALFVCFSGKKTITERDIHNSYSNNYSQ